MKNYSGWILPWLIVTVVDLGATFIVFISRLVSGIPPMGTAKILIAILYQIVTIYFIGIVMTYYKKLKRQKKLVKNLDLISNCTGKFFCWHFLHHTLDHPSLLGRGRFKPCFGPGYFLLQFWNYMMETCMWLAGVGVLIPWIEKWGSIFLVILVYDLCDGVTISS